MSLRKDIGAAVLLVAVAALILILAAPTYALEPGQLKPKRLASTGDSISAGIDVEFYGQNAHASWVNGYHGFWEWLLGLTNVKSHNQRITANWGSWGRKNYMDAVSGADMFDFPGQTAQAVSQGAQYVTVFMGHNDVCQNHPWEIPTDEVFEANFRAGMENLRAGLPSGATIYVLAIVDIKNLYEVAQDKKALGIIDCEVLWFTSLLELFPCGTMLSPLNSEADRLYTQGRNIAFNDILESVVADYQATDPNHFYYFSDLPFNYPFIESDVSDLDCFHPSAQGQKTLSRESWNDGPFKLYQGGS